MVLCDERHRITAVNDALARYSGYAVAELLGRRLEELAPADAKLSLTTIMSDQQSSVPGWIPQPVLAATGSRLRAEATCRRNYLPGRHLVVFRPAGRDPFALGQGRLLSDREREVISKVADGSTGADIAQQLFLSPATVERHVANALRKLGASNRAHGIALAIESGELSDRVPRLSGALTEEYGAADHQTLQALDAPAALLDVDGGVVAANDGWRAFEGDDARFHAEVGGNLLAVCDQAAADGDQAAGEVATGLREVLEDRSACFRLEYRRGSADSARFFELRASRYRSSGPGSLLVQRQDLTDRHHAKAQLALGIGLLDEVEAAAVSIDLDGRVTGWSPGAEKIFGWTRSEAIGRPAWELTVERCNRNGGREIFATCVRDGRWSGDVPLQRKDGTVFDARVRMRVLSDEHHEPTVVVAATSDISQLVETRRTLIQAQDELRAVSDSMRQGCVAIDSLGAITRVNAAAERLLGCEEADLLGQNMHEAVRSPLPITTRAGMERSGPAGPIHEDRFVTRQGVEIPVEYTVASFQRTDGTTGWVVLFAPIAPCRGRRANEIDADEPLAAALRRALLGDGFVLHAQPIVDLEDRTVHAHEMLLRMPHAGALIQPDQLLPVARRHGLHQAIDQHVCGVALRGPARHGPMHLNVTDASLADGAFGDVLRGAVAEADIAPARLIVELSGSALASSGIAGLAFVRELGDLGCGVVLDDFAAHPASIPALRHLSPALRGLKIDVRSFHDLAADSRARASVRAIVELAAGHDVPTIAQGVEDETIVDTLKGLGVRYAQGHLFGKPQFIA